MASAAEQLAANLSLSSFSKATELKKRIWFTLGALIIFRLLSYVPLPGIDPVAMSNLFQRTQGGVLDFFNMFSGGALERMSVIALGVMPYITARSEEHTSELQSLMRISYAVFCLKKKKTKHHIS